MTINIRETIAVGKAVVADSCSVCCGSSVSMICRERARAAYLLVLYYQLGAWRLRGAAFDCSHCLCCLHLSIY